MVNFGKTRKQLTNELRRCRLPHFAELEDMALRAIGDAAAGDIVLEDEPGIEAPVVVKPPCPWDILEGAPSYFDPYIRCLDRGMTHRAACQAVRKDPDVVSAELKRWKIGHPVAIKRRLREKQIDQLVHGRIQRISAWREFVPGSWSR